MNEPIKVGDLVVVVRWPCCLSEVGKVARVRQIQTDDCDLDCAECDAKLGSHLHWALIFEGGIDTDGADVGWIPVSYLKRIPPLSELEGERTQEDIREPA